MDFARSSLGFVYHGITHITPDTSTSVHKISNRVYELALHVITPNREGGDTIKPVIGTITLGEQKFKSSTSTTFNKKIQSVLIGEGFESEVDELPQASFALSLGLGDSNE